MLNNQKYFLIVAEELNIARAAKRIFVSQQCLSNHIKRLEEAYGVKLFHRKPRLALTKAGELIARTFRQIQILENNLENELTDINCGYKGILRIGLHTSRAQTLLPRMLPQYKALHPGVVLSIYSNVAREMEQMLLKGQLDLFVGNHPASAKGIHSILLMREPVFLVISDSMLKKYFPDVYPQCKEDFKNGIDIIDFKEVPFVMNLGSSNMRLFVDAYFQQRGITPSAAMLTNINEMHYQFSAMDYGASFCPGMMLSLLKSSMQEDNLNVFPLSDCTQRNNIILAHLENAYIPQYMQDFINITIKLFNSLDPENIIKNGSN